MLTAGEQQAKLLQNGPEAQISAQRLMLTDGSNPYAAQPHSEATLAQYNQQRTALPPQGQSYMPQQQQMMIAAQPVQMAPQQMMIAQQPGQPQLVSQQTMLAQQQMQPQLVSQQTLQPNAPVMMAQQP